VERESFSQGREFVAGQVEDAGLNLVRGGRVLGQVDDHR
jgi:ribosomal protein L13E